MPDDALETAVLILRRLREDGYAGADPYDALNATRVPGWVLANRRGRQLVTQAVKRSPVELRGALGVPHGVSAYTLGHALVAQARLLDTAWTADPADEATLTESMLDAASLSGYSGACWGYHFDVQTRFFFYARTEPNVIATAFAAKGLAAATEAGLIDGREAVMGACEFILNDLPRVRDGRGQSFGYVTHSDTIVHNANMLAALVLVLGARLGDDSGLLDEAVAAARFTVAHQRDDGAWPYSEQANGRWIDSFHTGFVLEGLQAVAAATGDDDLTVAFDKGMAYYVGSFFGPGGEPHYYDDRPLPYNALSAAQGIEVMAANVGDEPGFDSVLERLIGWTTSELVGSDGGVAFQVTGNGTDRRHFPRWSAGPVCSALALAGRRTDVR